MADYWIKLYHEIIDDPKMGTLPDRLWRRCIEMFLLAGRLGGDKKDGILPETNEIAWMLRMNPDELDMDLKQLATVGIMEKQMNGWKVAHFEKRQSPVSDAVRKQYQRDKQRHELVTKRDIKCHELVQEVETEQNRNRSRTEQNNDDDVTSLSPLSVAFVNATGIPELTGGPQKWIDALSKLDKAGVLPSDIETAVKEMRDKQYNIVSLSSIINPAISVMSKRKSNGKAPPTKPKSTRIVVPEDWHA